MCQPLVRTFPIHKNTLTVTEQEINDPGNKLVSKIKIINVFMGQDMRLHQIKSQLEIGERILACAVDFSR